MQLRSRQATLTTAIDDWSKRGLLDGGTAQALRTDVLNAKAGFTFRGFIILAGIICMCFGVMTFVAANWDDLPRPGRLFLIVGLLWTAWGGAVVAHRRNHPWLAHCLVLLACGIFGAGIMLVAQLYHIQGDPHDAVFLWMLGTGAAAALTRSAPALVLSVALLGLWGVTTDGLNMSQSDDVNWLFLPLWMLAATGCWLMQSRFAAHLTSLVLIGWVLFTLFNSNESEVAIFVCFLLGYILVPALLFSAGSGRLLRGFEGAALTYVLLFVGFLIMAMHGATAYDAYGRDVLEALRNRPVLYYGGMGIALVVTAALATAGRDTALGYDLAFSGVFLVLCLLAYWIAPLPILGESVMLAMSIWVVRMGWRADERSLRFIGFLGFGGAMLLIYFQTVGTLIGTSLFYVGAGFVFLAGAWIGARLKPEIANKRSGE